MRPLVLVSLFYCRAKLRSQVKFSPVSPPAWSGIVPFKRKISIEN